MQISGLQDANIQHMLEEVRIDAIDRFGKKTTVISHVQDIKVQAVRVRSRLQKREEGCPSFQRTPRLHKRSIQINPQGPQIDANRLWRIQSPPRDRFGDTRQESVKWPALLTKGAFGLN